MRDLRLRRPLRLGQASDPDRVRRDLPPTASLEDHIEDLVGWMIAGGFSPEDAQRQAEWIRHLHQQTGVNFLTLPSEEIVAFIAECDRQLEELDRQEAEDINSVSDGTEH
jgi:hypothetical protein